MSDRFASTKQDIVYELNQTIAELREIAWELRDVKGIGAELCVTKLNQIIGQCERTKGQLMRL